MPSVPISTSASGDTKLVTGVAGRSIKVLNIVMAAASAVNVKFRSNSTDLTGAVPMSGVLASNWVPYAAGGPIPHFQCAPGEDLNINLSGAVAVGGWLNYDITG